MVKPRADKSATEAARQISGLNKPIRSSKCAYLERTFGQRFQDTQTSCPLQISGDSRDGDSRADDHVFEGQSWHSNEGFLYGCTVVFLQADLYGDSTVTTSPNQTQSRDASTMDSFRRFWARPPPDPEVAQNRAELKEPEEKSWFRWSVFIVVLLCTGFVVGILITALAGDNKAMQVIGPVFIVLSLFALIGKIFWTLFWTPETHAVLKPVAQNINMLMYGPSGKRPDPMKKPAPGSYPRQTYTASGQIYQPSPQIHVQIYTNPAAQVWRVKR